jgi:hypothetical protein
MPLSRHALPSKRKRYFLARDSKLGDFEEWSSDQSILRISDDMPCIYY